MAHDSVDLTREVRHGLEETQALENQKLKNKILSFKIKHDALLSDFYIGHSLGDNTLHYQPKIGMPEENREQWGERERVILGVKQKLQDLQDKLQAEGDWGEVKFRMQGLEGKNPGAVKVKYKYGF